MLLVVNTVEYGGLEKDLIELVRWLADAGMEISILCFGPDFYTARLTGGTAANVKVICKAEPKSLLGWLKVLKEARTDVVIFDYGCIWAFPWYASAAALLARIPTRISIQQLIALPLGKIQGWSARNILKHVFGQRKRRILGLKLSNLVCSTLSGITICVSEAVRSRLVRDYYFSPHKTLTIYNGVSIAECTPSVSNRVDTRNRLKLDLQQIVFVCVARLSDIKGIDILLQAIAEVLRGGVHCKCVIVGDGPLRGHLSEQAKVLGLSEAVLFVGFQADVRPYLQMSDAFVLASHAEGLPLSVLEAMACGLPCIVTDVGGNAEAVTHGVCGLVVRRGCVEEVANAISYLAGHPEERLKMSRNARGRVCETFDIEHRMARIQELIVAPTGQ